MNLAVTVALLPALFLGDDGPAGPIDVLAGTRATAPVEAAAVSGRGAIAVLAPNELAASAATTTTTAPPKPKPTPRPKVVATAEAAPRTTPITHAAPKAPAKPASPPTTQSTAPQAAPPAARGNTESGKASWYDHQPGICAHKTLPFGTVVTVTSTANGKRTSCTVGDRGPYIAGWVIDLNPREFEQLAPRSAGVISVRLDW